jgi:hypothetical protein
MGFLSKAKEAFHTHAMKTKEASNIHVIEINDTDYDGEEESFFHSYGRLGNQLFHIAAMLNIQDKNKSFKTTYIGVSLDNNRACIYDWGNIFKKNIVDHCSERLDNEYDVVVKETRRISNGRIYQELPVFPRKRVLYNIACYSYKYFEDLDIHNYFIFKDKIVDHIQEKYSDLLKYKTASIHVRRGDYLSEEWINTLWHCSNKYYKTALSMLEGIEKVAVFSDDIEWCKKNFKGNKFVFIEGESDYVDLCLMSFIQNNIIANSTFSWWGAYLNQNKDKRVICPEYYFKNIPEQEDAYFNKKYLYPDSWTPIDNR